MTIAESKPTGVILIDCQDSVGGDVYFNTAAPQDNVLVFNCGTTSYIEPLLSALRAHYLKFNAVSFVTNNVDIHTELTRFFPELFRGIRFVEQLPVPLKKSDMIQLMSSVTTLPAFELMPEEPLVSAEFERLKNFFLLDERLTDISEHDAISQLTEAFLAAVSAQRCAFSAFVQIRLLSFYSDKLNKYGDIYFKSLSLKCADENISSAQLWLTVSDPRFSLNERYFIYNQILSMEFGGVLKNKSDFDTRFDAYGSLVEQFAGLLGTPGAFIDQTQRNPDIIFVFIGQFLGLSHAPSKIALEIVKSLCVSAKKQVVLIDTCELLPVAGAVPWYDAAYGNRGQYNAETLTYEGAHFNYLQLSAAMPNLEEMHGIVDLVNTYKPYFSVTVGESVIADIISQLVPNVVVPTVGRLPHTLSQYRIFNQRFISDIAVIPDFLQPGILSVDILPEQNMTSAKLERQQLGIPKDKVVLAVLGNRLDAEIDDNFISMLLSISATNYFVVFAGVFTRYEHFCNKFPALSKISAFVGYQSDLPAFIRLVDIYVNPPRVGGGITALTALRESVPVLTLSYGDVYSFAGDALAFNALEDMANFISTVCTENKALNDLKITAHERFVQLENNGDKYTDLFEKVQNSAMFNAGSFVLRAAK